MNTRGNGLVWSVAPFWASLTLVTRLMASLEHQGTLPASQTVLSLRTQLERECEQVRPDMSAAEIAAIDNLVFRAFALLHTRRKIDRQTFERLAASVNVEAAGPLGLKVQEDLIAVVKADSLAKVAKIERQLEKRIKALDGFWRALLVGTAENAALSGVTSPASGSH